MSISNIDKIREKLEKLKKVADAMYYSAQYLTTDASRLHKAMDEYHKFIINEYHKEEPVSEDLDIAIGEYCSNPDNFITYIDVAFAYRSEQKDDIPLIIKAIKFGANWQKQKDAEAINENALLYSARLEGIEIGKAEMKQQMMAKAVDVTVHIDAGGYPHIPQIELYDYDKDIPLAKEGDRYKVVLIKED